MALTVMSVGLRETPGPALMQAPHEGSMMLPPFLRELTVLSLRIGESRVSLHFSRKGNRTLANLLAVEGEPLQVRIELS